MDYVRARNNNNNNDSTPHSKIRGDAYEGNQRGHVPSPLNTLLPTYSKKFESSVSLPFFVNDWDVRYSIT